MRGLLGEAPLDLRPLVCRHDPWDEVERRDSVGARLVPVHREPDPLGLEERVRGADPFLQPIVDRSREPLVQRPVMRARPPRPVDHRVEERTGVVAGDEARRGRGSGFTSRVSLVRPPV